MQLRTLIAAAGSALLIFASAATTLADTPGTAPGARATKGKPVIVPDSASGLQVFYRVYGKFQTSVDAAGSNDSFHNIKVLKPTADAVVRKAFLMSASNWSTPIANGDVKLDGNPITWIASHINPLPPSYPSFFHSVLADVTSIVKPKVDARATAGTVHFRLTEVNNNVAIDGEVLVVVFAVPSMADTQKRTVALMFGGQKTSGDRFEITMQPFSKTDPNALARMGLGISYSWQGTAQYSTIDVNGRRLSTSAGGQDDGGDSNGSLITAGGIGDSHGNPSPTATPSTPRTDDEHYNLLPFIRNGDRVIRIDTVNPSDDDNIFFAWFELTSVADVNKDTDGDGLLDSWEISGYDHDGDGVIDVPIHQMGADYRKKDIFIAYAWMNKSASETVSHKPSNAVLNAVKAAFARAPVSNPDGTRGINVHFVDKGGVPHDNDLNPVWTEFDAIMDPLVSEAERKIYHRMLNAHGYSGGSSSGLSRGIPASDFIESLGNWSSNPGTFHQRAGTIMHELGHNLGLRHGGVDHENYKPNHLSVMSYLNQTGWLLKNASPYLDYERFDLGNLDEANLSEPAGLNRAGGDAPISTYGVRWMDGGTVRSKTTGANANVDWNNNGAANQTGLSKDLNNSGGTSVLGAGFVEWDHIVFDGGNIGEGSAAEKRNLVRSPKDLDELTEEEDTRMKR